MNDQPLMISSYPRAILHCDGDAFFASVEQALSPSLRGKPVVTGKERGIIAAASYEAKARGVARGLPLFEAKRICPDLVILPSDYETYGLYSRRMFNIMRKFTPDVEEYSIDEGFADITGLRRVFHASYEDIARRLQAEIHHELNITVSVGLSLSKSLAKLCSKFRKPAGFTAVPGKYIHLLLQKTPLDKVWGFGPNTVSLLTKQGLQTAYDFVLRPEGWAAQLLGKPGREMWKELRGYPVWPLSTEEKTSYGTLIKSKTFTPPSGERTLVYAKLVRNAESVFLRARRHHLRAGMVAVVLRRHDFHHDGVEARLSRPATSAQETLPLLHDLFGKVFAEGRLYRATMIVLGRLADDRTEQYDLFEDRLQVESVRRMVSAVDGLNAKYGKHTVHSGATLFLKDKEPDDRDDAPPRRDLTLPGETGRQRLAFPRMDIAC